MRSPVRTLALALALVIACDAAASDGTSSGGMVVYGADALPCLGDPVMPDLYQAQLRSLYDQTVAMEETRSLFEVVRQAQACLTDVVSPADLARPSFLEGVTAFSDGRDEDALAAFEQVFVTDPAHVWDDEYPPPAQHAFIDGEAAALRRSRAALKVVVPAGGAAWIDGVEFAGDSVEVIAGTHLVQVRSSEGGAVRTVRLQVDPNARVLVTVPFDPDSDQTPSTPVASSNLVTFRTSRTAPVFLAVGAGLAAIGGVVTAISVRSLQQFNEGVSSGEFAPFPSSSAQNPEEFQLYRVWQSHTRDVTVGIALMGVGAGVMVLSIPIHLAHRSHQMGVTAAVPMDADGPSGFALEVVIR